MRIKPTYLFTILFVGVVFILFIASAESLASTVTAFHRVAVKVKERPTPTSRPLTNRTQTRRPQIENVNTATANINFNLSDSVSIGVPFNFDIWYDDLTPESIHVVMERSDKIKYEPHEFDLRPQVHQTIAATVLRAQSGLAVIKASIGSEANPISIPVNAGFTAKLRAKDLGGTVESGSIQNFVIGLVDDHENAIQIDAAVKVRVEVSRARIRLQGTNVWQNVIDTDIKRGQTSTSVIEMEPQWVWSSSAGSLKAEVRLIDSTDTDPEDTTVLFHDTVENFRIVPRWWLPLLAATFGGIAFSLYQLTQEFGRKGHQHHRLSMAAVLVSRIAPGALAGTLAYFLANWRILGFQIDTTALHGFLVLGFLFSYVGIDTILKILVHKKESELVPATASPSRAEQ